MTVAQSLGSRMREYIDINNTRLIKRTPVIVNVDGAHFHNLTRFMDKPFSMAVIGSMWDAALYLVSHMEGAKVAYVQSDEISVLLTNYETLNQGAMFDYRVQKLASTAAALATAGFNKKNRIKKVATFDGRCFNLQKEEVNNYFIWRQQDWTRNSIQMLARSHFSQNDLYKKNHSQLQDMLFEKCGVNWNDLDPVFKRGACIIKNNGNWIVDRDIPIFSKERGYIEHFVYPEKDLSMIKEGDKL